MTSRTLLFALALPVLCTGSSGCGDGRSERTAIEADLREARLVLFSMAGCYFNDEIPPPADADTLTALLTRIGASPGALQPPADSAAHSAGRLAGLRSSLASFIAARSNRSQFDTVRRAFRDVLYAFHNCYGEYFRRMALRGAGDRLLLFSASVTCDCTSRLSDRYTVEIILARRNIEDFPEFLLMDCSAEPGLMERYAVDTIPAVLILGGGDAELARFQGMEQILPPLVEFLALRRGLEMPGR